MDAWSCGGVSVAAMEGEDGAERIGVQEDGALGVLRPVEVAKLLGGVLAAALAVRRTVTDVVTKPDADSDSNADWVAEGASDGAADGAHDGAHDDGTHDEGAELAPAAGQLATATLSASGGAHAKS
jgi:hypothetical protein